MELAARGLRERIGTEIRSGVGFLAIAVTLLALALLLPRLDADPTLGVTWSSSPFTDEGWSVMGARNAILLGRWTTDEWQLVITQLPLNAVAFGVFSAFGVGIVQARIVSVVCSAVTVGLIAWLVGRRVGRSAGLIAAAVLATSPLFIYYGRLAILEPMVITALVATGCLLLAARSRSSWRVGILVGLAGAVAIGTKVSAAAPLIGILAGATVIPGSGRQALARRSVIAIAVMVGLGLAWALAVMASGISIPAAIRPWPETGISLDPATILLRVFQFFAWDYDQALVYGFLIGILGLVGLVAVAQDWRRLDERQQRVAGMAVGWIVVGLGVLLISSYRPNRYLVAMLPPFAILAGMGLSSIARRAGRLRPVAVGGLLVLLVASGVRFDRSTPETHDLVHAQADLAARLPRGAVVEGGLAPTLAMRAAVTTIVVQGEVNRGDLYTRHGVRWILAPRNYVPDWVATHASAWASREIVACYPWRPRDVCLVRVPDRPG